MRTYTIELSEQQLRVVNKALDMYSRMGMGQLDVAVEEFLRTTFYKEYVGQPKLGYQVSNLISQIKLLMFGHTPSSSWGIRSPNVPVECREAYDIMQVTRKTLAETRMADPLETMEAKKHLRFSVSMSDYMETNPELPPVKCTGHINNEE